MKLLYPVVTALTLSTLSFATLAKDLPTGTWEVAGGSNLQFLSAQTEIDGNSGETEFDQSTFSIEATARYYFQNNLAFQLGYEYSNETTEYEDNSEEETSSFALKPGIAYNHSLNEDAAILFYANLFLGRLEYDETFGDSVEGDLSGFGFGAEYRQFVRDNISLNIGASYFDTETEFDDDNDTTLSISGTQIAVGASLYLF
ncbi:MAG: outer membrane beta-barrel protein [Oleibacter sp.]|nr:outer membrane beta-barrel protein [Thalassolituus sp.]